MNPGSSFSLESKDGRFSRLYLAYTACKFLGRLQTSHFFWMVPFERSLQGSLQAATTYDEKNELFALAFAFVTLKITGISLLVDCGKCCMMQTSPMNHHTNQCLSLIRRRGKISSMAFPPCIALPLCVSSLEKLQEKLQEAWFKFEIFSGIN